MTQATHEGNEQKPTDERQDEVSPSGWDRATSQAMGGVGVGATEGAPELNPVGYRADQAAARVAAKSAINNTPIGSEEAVAAVIANARLGRPLLIDQAPDLGAQARFMAEAAQELLRDYALDVARYMAGSAMQDNPAAVIGLVSLLRELSFISSEENRDTIVRAISILNGVDTHQTKLPQDRLAGFLDDLAAMRVELAGRQEGPGV